MQKTQESYEISVKVDRTTDGDGGGKTSVHVTADNDALVKLGAFWTDVAVQAAPFLQSIPFPVMPVVQEKKPSRSEEPPTPPRPPRRSKKAKGK